jgi:hypothetical protein
MGMELPVRVGLRMRMRMRMRMKMRMRMRMRMRKMSYASRPPPKYASGAARAGEAAGDLQADDK